MKKTAITFIVLMLAATCSAAAQRIIEKQWQGSILKIAVPEVWNKKALLLAHGYRPPDLPLTADFDVDNVFYGTLIQNGWLVASTSYRKNGIAYVEGIADMGLLRDFVIQQYGMPDEFFLLGESMGGAIAITLAEKHYQGYAGVLCIDPAIRKELAFTRKPMIPILFLCNQNEIEPVTGYIAALIPDAATPAQWRVLRDGHVNVNPEERLAAFSALVQYEAGTPIDLDRNILIIPENHPSKALFADGGAYTEIIRVHPKYGNLDTAVVPADFRKLGIHKGDQFTVAFKDTRVRVFFGTTFGDVEKGAWIAFFKEDGRLKIARNHASAVDTLKCRLADKVFIAR